MHAYLGARQLMSRINRVTTQTGDNGTTALGTGRRVSKTDPMITALGSVDELSSLLGVLRNLQINPELNEAYFALSVSSLMRGEMGKAQHYYQEALLKGYEPNIEHAEKLGLPH